MNTVGKGIIEDNYKISTLNAYSLKYTEKDHVMIIPMDFRKKIPDFSLDDIKGWDFPHNDEFIDVTKKIQILKNIFGYLECEGYKKIYIHKYGYLNG